MILWTHWRRQTWCEAHVRATYPPVYERQGLELMPLCPLNPHHRSHPNTHPALGARVCELRMECRAQRTRLHLIASLQALSLTWLHWTDELRQWTRAHNRKKWILITAFSGGCWSWLEPTEAIAGWEEGAVSGPIHEPEAGSRQGTWWSFRMLNQYTGEEPWIHREPYYCRRLVLMISFVICVCFLLVTDTHGITFFFLIVYSSSPPETSAS